MERHFFIRRFIAILMGSMICVAVYAQQHTLEETDLNDLRNRELVLDFIENIRESYKRKDIAYISEVYLGEVYQGNDLNINRQNVYYSTMSKEEYLSNLRKAFAKNENINIKFEDVKIERHPRNPNIYGITLRQKWSTSTYNDDGWLFMMIDFTDKDNPLILKRTWQSYEKTPKDEIFKLEDFLND